MNYKRTIKIPVHYNVTKSKLNKLDKLTARLTSGTQLFLNIIEETDCCTRFNLVAYEQEIKNKTKLSSGYIQQCKDKAIWMYKGYKKLHKNWEKKLSKSKGIYYQKLLQREPSFPKVNKKISVRLDYRTLKIKFPNLSFFPLWFDISSLKKFNKIMIPLNPSYYHLLRLQQGRIIDCELIKKDKYYLHITCEYYTPLQPIRNIRSIDLGINRSVTTVLYTSVNNQINILKECEKKHRLEQFDNLIAILQNLKKWNKLKRIRKKRANFIEDQERKLANYIATISQNSIF